MSSLSRYDLTTWLLTRSLTNIFNKVQCAKFIGTIDVIYKAHGLHMQPSKPRRKYADFPLQIDLAGIIYSYPLTHFPVTHLPTLSRTQR